MGMLAVGNRDVNDLRQNSSALFPPEHYLNLLANATIMAKIGAESAYGECTNPPYNLFEKTGDVSVSAVECVVRSMIFTELQDARSLLPRLAALVNSKLKILIWVSPKLRLRLRFAYQCFKAGDADIKCVFQERCRSFSSTNTLQL